MARPKKNTEIKTENEVAVVQNETVSDFNLTAQITAGKLTSNAKELREKIEGELLNYSVERYLDKPEMAKAEEERKKAEAENAAKNAVSVEKEPENANINAEFAEKLQNSVENQDKNGKLNEIPAKKEPVLSYKLEVFGTKEKLFALRKFIDENKIEYRKL